MNLATSARRMIEENLYMTIASASSNGKPWVSPVYFAYDSQYNFYWCSAKSALHSTLLRKNSRAAVVIFNSKVPEGTGDEVYMAGKASEVRREEIPRAVKLLCTRTGKSSSYFKKQNPEEYSGASPIRIYKFTPTKFWMLGKPVKVKGKLFDVRREVVL